MKHDVNKNRPLLIAAVCLLSVVLVALFAGALMLERGVLPQPGGKPAQTSPVQTGDKPSFTPEATSLVIEEGGMIELETPYCILYFPDMWEDLLHINPVEEDRYRMEFSCRFEDGQIHRLFDISFGLGEGNMLGTVAGPDGEKTSVNVLFYEPDASLQDDLLNTFLAMQEGANELIARLPLVGEEEENQYQGVLVIETPFARLEYPARWEDYLHLEHEGGGDYTVVFYAQLPGIEQVRLFSVSFGTETENALLVLTGDGGAQVGVNVKMAESYPEGLNQEQRNIVYSMQDAVNELLDALAEE